jgi:hypothetical protein
MAKSYPMADDPEGCAHSGDITVLGQLGLAGHPDGRLVTHPDGDISLASHTAAAYFGRCETCGLVIASVALYEPGGSELHTGFHLLRAVGGA